MNKRNGGKATTLHGANRQIRTLENAMEGLRGLLHKRDHIIADFESQLDGEKAKCVELFDECIRLRVELTKTLGELTNPAPIPLRLECPACHRLHVDKGKFATKPHHTHSCQYCGLSWRPAVVHTVGVQFLPGFKDATPADYNTLASQVLAGKISVNDARKLVGLPELEGGNTKLVPPQPSWADRNIPGASRAE